MKDKDVKNQSTNKVVPIPKLYERIVNKGIDELRLRKFKQAAALFSQAREFDQENSEVNLGLLVSLVELQYYEEARTLCYELLKRSIGDYFQIMSIYLMVLLQLNEHEEMVETIELLFQENQIPFDKLEHYEKMLSFSQKMLKESKVEAERQEEQLQRQFQQEGLFADKDDQELLDVITKLSKINVRPFIDEIQQFLQEEGNHPFFKTMLVNILKEQDYAQPIELRKFSKTAFIIPAQLPDLRENDFFRKVFALTEEELSQRDPSLLEITHSLLERHHFLLYPFEPEQDFTAIAAAYHALATEYMTGQEVSDVVTQIYELDARKVRECLTYLKEIEAISYPIF